MIAYQLSETRAFIHVFARSRGYTTVRMVQQGSRSHFVYQTHSFDSMGGSSPSTHMCAYRTRCGLCFEHDQAYDRLQLLTTYTHAIKAHTHRTIAGHDSHRFHRSMAFLCCHLLVRSCCCFFPLLLEHIE
jgi:hypothetical protein